jgi:hypothetical protein
VPAAPEAPEASVPGGGVDPSDAAQLPTSASKAEDEDEKSENDTDESKDEDEEKPESGDDQDT